MVGVVFAFRNPRAALFGLVACDFIRPQSGEDGRVVFGLETVKFSLVLNLVAIVMLVVRAGKYRLRWEKFHGGVLCILLAVAWSALWAFRPALRWPRVYDYTLTVLQYVFIC